MPGVSVEQLSITSQDNGVNKLYITAEETQEEAKVQGIIPSYISGGKYMRIGPAKFDFPGFTMNHWLDGYGMISKFEIQEDIVKLEKKYVQSDAYIRAMAAQKPVVNEFGTRAQSDGKKSFFSRIISSLFPEFTDNSYSTLFTISSDLFATCDTQFFQRMDPSSLQVCDKCDTSKLFSLNGQCAHPIIDCNGDVYNLGFSLGATGAKCHVIKLPFNAKSSEEMIKNVKVLSTISPRWPGQIASAHSFGMSENFIIFIEQPYTVSIKRIAASLVKGDVLKEWLFWTPEEKNKIILIEKSSGKIYKTEFMSAKAFYFLHVVNCYEESNQVVVDIVVYDSPKVLDKLTIENLRSPTCDLSIDLPYIQRFVVPIIPDLKVSNFPENLNLVNGIKTECTAIRTGNKIILTGERLTGFGLDLPMINKRCIGRKYRYVYAAATVNENDYSNSICRVDLETKEVLTWKQDEFTSPGEPFFVPDPKGTRENEGTVVFALTDRRMGHDDYLIFLDAASWTEVARVAFKTHVPSSLHGIFLPN